MGDDFGVGLAGEGVAPCLEFFPQGGMVLDDAVVDEGNPFTGKVRRAPLKDWMPTCFSSSATRAVLRERWRRPLRLTAMPQES